MAKIEKTFNIAWDCDGVWADSYQPVLDKVNQELSNLLSRPIIIVKSDLTDWDALTRLTLSLTNNTEIAARLTKYWYDPETLRKSPLNSAVMQVFEMCQELSNTTQCVITTRSADCADSTRDWLNQHLPSVDWKQNLHIRSVTDTVRGDDFKIERLQILKIRHMSEDNPVTVSRIAIQVPECSISYVSQPWNSTDVDSSRSLLRVPSDNPEIIYKRILESRKRFFETN